MKILVTGGAGFIGSYICEALIKKRYQVRILDNLDPQVHGGDRNWPSYLPPEVEQIFGDVRDRDTIARALEDCEAVIHLAAAVGVGQSMYKINHYSSVNVIGTAILLEEIIKKRDRIQKLIVAGSMSSYGEGAYLNSHQKIVCPLPRSIEQMRLQKWEHFDDDGNVLDPIATREHKVMQPQSIYAINKKDQEDMALVIGRAYKIPTVVMRMFNVFGPRQALSNPYTGVVAIFCSRLLNEQPPLVFEDGQQKRDLVYVEDVAQAYVMALESNSANYHSLNVGSGNAFTILEIVQTLTSVLDIDIEPSITQKFREGDIRHCFANIDLIKKTLGWSPQRSFESGIQKLAFWLRAQNSADRVIQAKDELISKGLLK